MSIDVDSSYVTEDSNVETIEEVPCSPEEEFDTRLLSGNLTNLRFPLKLWRIVTDCSTGAIRWINNGTAIAINYQIFEREYLDASTRLFKTNNITSFVRQLNLYGFRKVPKNSKTGASLPVSFSSANYSIFHHESFRSDRPDLLLHVNRRGIKPDGKKNRMSTRVRREPRRRLTVSSEQNATSSDSESSETGSSISVEQVIEDGIVELDHTDLLVPFRQHDIMEEVIPLPPNEIPTHKSKRKSPHQVRNMETKRSRVRSESAITKPVHVTTLHRSGSISANINQQSVAEEFIRKIRNTSESKDDISVGSTNNSVQEYGDDDDEENDREEMHLRNGQFIFDMKHLQHTNRERVRVERLTRHFETNADIRMKHNDYGMDAMREEEVLTEGNDDDLDEDDDGRNSEESHHNDGNVAEEIVEEDSGAVLDEIVPEAQSSDYFAEEHNTARALLSLTCAKLQRNVAGLKSVMEPASLTTAGLS